MHELSEKEKTFWFIIFVAEGVIIICCNVIAVIIFTRKIHQSKSCILLVNQSIADFLVGAKVLHFSPQYTSIDSFPSHKLIGDCRPIENIVKLVTWNYVIDVSLSSLSLISLERACAVFMPFRHRIPNKRTYYYAILGTWIVCFLPSSTVIILRCKEEKLRNTFTFAIGIISVLSSLLTIVVVHFSIHIKPRLPPTMHMNRQSQRQIKLCRTLLHASAASIITILPSTLQQIYSNSLGKQNRNMMWNLNEVLMLLLFSNSFVNFVIYAWRFPEFSEDMKKLFSWKRPTVNDVSVIEMTERIGQTRSNK